MRGMSPEIVTGALGTEEVAYRLTQESRESAQGRRGGQENARETQDLGAEQKSQVWQTARCGFLEPALKRVLKSIKKWNKMRIETIHFCFTSKRLLRTRGE